MLLMKKGFTLIELLVVIAIIAILSAIIFPVFARAKYAAYRSSDMSNLNSIRTALQLYRADQEAYPPVLLGYINPYAQQTTGVIPANALQAALYPKLVNSLQTLQPALDRATFGATNINLAMSTAIWPNGITSGGQFSQQFGPTNEPSSGYVMGCWPQTPGEDNPLPNQYYTISGYDVESVEQPAGPKTGTSEVELHYTLFWSQNGVAHDPCRPGANPDSGNAGQPCNGDGLGCSSDSPRQLGYSNPPDSTVVTWDSFFRDPIAGGEIPQNKGDIVLFLGGAAKPYSSQIIGTQAWQATP